MELNHIREHLDQIDTQLTELLVERMTAVAQVAQAKKESGKAIRDHARERSIINRVTEQSGDEYAPYVKSFYKTLFDLSCNYQSQKMGYSSALAAKLQEQLLSPELRTLPGRATVACQGTEGAYAQQACEKLFEYPSILYFNSFNDVFSAVEKGMCKYGILPLENSTAGSVTQVYDLMEQHAFHIVGACRLRIDHCLMRKKGSTAPITKVVSHEQALRQCSDYLEKHPEYKAEPMENTAVAAEYVANAENAGTAVIASAVCAEIYGLEIVDDNISNVQNNFTRFICIARDMNVYPDARIYGVCESYDVLFVIALLVAGAGLIINSTLDLKPREKVKDKAPISLDRFILLKGWSQGVCMVCYAFSYGVLATYIAIYGKNELGITGGTGLFFMLLSIGLILSRLIGNRSLREGKIVENASGGVVVALLGYLVFAAFHNYWGYYGAALIIGLGNGHMFPAFQTMFINLASNEQRGTANSTLLVSWDIGVGLGILIGGSVAEHLGYYHAFWTAFAVNMVGVLLFYLYSRGNFLKNRLR